MTKYFYHDPNDASAQWDLDGPGGDWYSDEAHTINTTKPGPLDDVVPLSNDWVGPSTPQTVQSLIHPEGIGCPDDGAGTALVTVTGKLILYKGSFQGTAGPLSEFFLSDIVCENSGTVGANSIFHPGTSNYGEVGAGTLFDEASDYGTSPGGARYVNATFNGTSGGVVTLEGTTTVGESATAVGWIGANGFSSSGVDMTQLGNGIIAATAAEIHSNTTTGVVWEVYRTIEADLSYGVLFKPMLTEVIIKDAYAVPVFSLAGLWFPDPATEVTTGAFTSTASVNKQEGGVDVTSDNPPTNTRVGI